MSYISFVTSWLRQYAQHLKGLGLTAVALLLVALPHLTDLGGYLIVDEADRWRWARDFVYALVRGDLAATKVGDGYPGIVPVWAESLWVLLEAGRRSLLEGRWIGEPGLYQLFHEWDRVAYLSQQRLPLVLLNTMLTLAIIWAVWRLFGKQVALVGGVLLALDPFYLSDARVNRAEAVITGLMTLSILFLIFYDRKRQWRYVVLSGVLGGLSFLTKIQALVLLPIIALVGLVIFFNPDKDHKVSSFISHAKRSSFLKFGLLWFLAAVLTWCLFWPAMWVIPLDTLTLVYTYATRKVDAEGVNLFFWGQTYQDTDPGFWFYPVVFLMRITPLALLGLGGVVLSLRHQVSRVRLGPTEANAPSTARGDLILLIYVFIYALLMTLGSHKQDRYLLPIFLSVDILAAIGLVYLGRWFKIKLGLLPAARLTSLLRSSRFASLLLTSYCLLLFLQLITVLPHHPYYYSYFNPLFGGGQTAARLLRIGWGEGMDQVGAYLAAKPDSRHLVVSSRFTHNMLGFGGELISLEANGRWTQADYIVLYIQQVQRRLDPSPGFLDYFQAKSPEKVINIGGIDYAWIYPIPFTVPANPQVSVVPGQAALLGYRWEETRLRLLWENQGPGERPLVARLVGHNIETAWAACVPDAQFVVQAGTPGAYVESMCAPALAALPSGIYTVEFGLRFSEKEVTPFLFPQGWQAARLTSSGEVADTAKTERLEAIVAETIPLPAQRLNRVYNSHIRLAAYHLEPSLPQPGDTVNLTLYWQPVSEIVEPVKLVVELADSRQMSLGRSDMGLYSPAQGVNPVWLPGQVMTTSHHFSLSPDLDSPLAAQVEVSLLNQAEVLLKATNLAGEPLDKIIGRLTIAPPSWPTLDGATPVTPVWQNGLTLRGYAVVPEPAHPGETLKVRLLWQTSQPVTDNYMVFVHLLDETNQLKMQSDSFPRAGAYPTPWWQPGQMVADVHILALPADLPTGAYRLAVGFYRPEDGARLRLTDGRDSVVVGAIQVTKD